MRSIKVTSTELVHTGHSAVEGITLIPGSDAATIVLNDSLLGDGTDKGGVKTASTESVESSLYGERFAMGIYATITGTGAVAYIYIK